MSAKIKDCWTKSDKTIAGLPTVRNIVNQNKGFPELKAEYEFAAVGEYGEIWLYSPGVYKALIHDVRTANKAATLLGDKRSIVLGEELILTLNDSNVLQIAKLMRIEYYQNSLRANSFGRE